jgi:hypothetical protein
MNQQVTADSGLILEYINSLFAIETLRNANPKNVTLMTAHTFGIDSNAIWKQDKPCTQDFMHAHNPELVEYNIAKIICMLNKLNDGLNKLKTPLYTNVPLGAEDLNAIINGIENIFTKKRGTIFPVDSSLKNTRNISVVPDFDMQLMSNVLKNVFNSFTGERRDLDTRTLKKAFGQHRHEVIDGLTYVNFDKIHEILSKEIGRVLDGKVELNEANVKFIADLFGVLYRLRVPVNLHPNRLDRLYDKYILTDERAAEAIQYARKFSVLEPIDVISCHLLPFEESMIFDDIFPHERSIASYTYRSEVEQYLVTQYLIQK